jgi:predicted dehydrogenase
MRGKLIGVSTRRERTRDHGSLFPGVHPALMTLVHDIDVAQWITGARAARVTAVERRLEGDAFPSLVWAHVEASDDSVWSLQTTWVLPDGEALYDRLEVFGSTGAVTIELDGDYAAPALDAELAHFCACLQAGTEPELITLTEAAHGIEIAEAIMRSTRDGGVPVELESGAGR